MNNKIALISTLAVPLGAGLGFLFTGIFPNPIVLIAAVLLTYALVRVWCWIVDRVS